MTPGGFGVPRGRNQLGKGHGRQVDGKLAVALRAAFTTICMPPCFTSSTCLSGMFAESVKRPSFHFQHASLGGHPVLDIECLNDRLDGDAFALAAGRPPWLCPRWSESKGPARRRPAAVIVNWVSCSSAGITAVPAVRPGGRPCTARLISPSKSFFRSTVTLTTTLSPWARRAVSVLMRRT